MIDNHLIQCHVNAILLSVVSGKLRMLKLVSLVTLTVQNAVLGLSMRYAWTRPGDKFLSSTGNRTVGVGQNYL